MPPPEESVWWRGKHEFLVGFFPSNCVAVITDKVPRNLYKYPQILPISEPTKSVLRFDCLIYFYLDIMCRIRLFYPNFLFEL